MTDDLNPRIAPLPPQRWPREMKDALAPLSAERYGRPPQPPGRPKGLNVLGTFAHHPTLAAAFMQFNAHVMHTTTLTERQRELVVLRVATVYHCDYEWAQHEIIAGDRGDVVLPVGRIGPAVVQRGPAVPDTHGQQHTRLQRLNPRTTAPAASAGRRGELEPTTDRPFDPLEHRSASQEAMNEEKRVQNITKLNDHHLFDDKPRRGLKVCFQHLTPPPDARQDAGCQIFSRGSWTLTPPSQGDSWVACHAPAKNMKCERPMSLAMLARCEHRQKRRRALGGATWQGCRFSARSLSQWAESLARSARSGE